MSSALSATRRELKFSRDMVAVISQTARESFVVPEEIHQSSSFSNLPQPRIRASSLKIAKSRLARSAGLSLISE
jgi:hypothetical protein